MPSRFPGMDLYLESPRLWPAFQHQLVLALQTAELALLKNVGAVLLERYQSNVAVRCYTDDSGHGIVEEYLEIRQRSDGKLITLVRLPLARDDRDVVVDLQAAFSRAFEQGSFGEQIDYCCEPDVLLTPDRFRRVAALLKWPAFSHQEIAAAAYRIWEKVNPVHAPGRDKSRESCACSSHATDAW